MDPQSRNAFIISDRTAVTAEALGNSLLSQFPTVRFNIEILPFIDSQVKANRAVELINQANVESGQKPIVFATLVDDDVRGVISRSDCEFFDLFDTFVNPLELVLGTESSHKVGLSHGMSNAQGYTARIGAMNYALETDDGIETRSYRRAQIIIVGVSRSGKTPTCLYLALQYGVYAANYPLTDSELDSNRLPEVLEAHKDKLFGLTIDPFRLQQIRQERYNRASYASARQCQYEVAQTEAIFRRSNVMFLNSTQMSVEELGAKIMQKTGLKRQY
ncbi:MAG: kinase/pyrophosphorylase [Acidobacteriota bacterium]|nr:kinase/pyrophosphorylase [Acidobacteriota bacterium]MDH3528774.1 kinase/pyrophosphorylase [Acidobacteriota bacterium]